MRATPCATAFLFAILFARVAAGADVIPPRLERDDGVAYPREALAAGFYEATTVELVLEIDANGSVQTATVTSPAGHGFDDAAVQAARTLRFKPASRDGVPVASRIRFRYSFEPPPPSLTGRAVDPTTGRALGGARITVRAADGATQTLETDPEGSWRAANLARGPAHVTAESEGHVAQDADVVLTPGDETHLDFRLEPSARASEASSSAPETPTEVRVRGDKAAPSVSSFSRSEVRNLPGAFGDPFRAIEALPGVTPIVSGLPFFYVRGAPPGNVGYYLDGVAVPALFHVGFGPSVVHPALIERVDLHPGGYPARFGRFAGGIVSADAAAPRTELHGEANIRLFDAGAMVETGFAGDRGTVLLGGRYSYTGALASLVAPDVKLDYRDYQARVSYDLGPRDRLSAFAFGSFDLVGTRQKNILSVLYGSEFYRLDLRHDHAIEGGAIRTAITLGYDQTRLDDLRNARDRMIAARTELRKTLGQSLLFRGGADVRFDAFSTTRPRFADPDDPEVKSFGALFPPRDDITLGTWADLVLDVVRGVQVTPGIAINHFRSGSANATAVDPRLTARIAVTDRVRILQAYGLAHQTPSFVLPGAGLAPGKLQGGLQTSAQTSAGLEVDVAEKTTASGTLFYNAFFDMTDALGANAQGPPDQGADERSRGSAFGLELFIRRRLTERLGGLVSYTLSRSVRRTSAGQFPSAFDRTHVVNAALAYDLGRGWRAGGRLVFYTGTPKGLFASGGSVASRTADVERNPLFHRVDLRLEKRWAFGGPRYISFVAEIMNVTLSKETFGDETIGPITVPSIGVEGGL